MGIKYLFFSLSFAHGGDGWIAGDNWKIIPSVVKYIEADNCKRQAAVSDEHRRFFYFKFGLENYVLLLLQNNERPNKSLNFVDRRAVKDLSCLRYMICLLYDC